MTRFGKDVKTMGKQLGRLVLAGGGIYALQRGLRSIVKAASDAQETQAKFNTVFKELSGEANKWAVDFGKSVGRSEQSVKSWMARLQDTFVPLGIARDEAMKLSQSLVGLAVDVASFNNAADADVIRDFTSALVGNHETVRKFGIIISESAIAQEALAQGMNKTFKQLTDLEKVQLRYSLIQKGSTDAQGDALRTADSFANQVKRLHANLEDMRKELGGPFMESLNSMITSINKNSEAWSEFFKTQSEGWAEILSGMENVKKAWDEYLKRKGFAPNAGRAPAFGGGVPGLGGVPSAGQKVPELQISPRGYQRIERMNAYLRREREIAKGINQWLSPESLTGGVTSIKAIVQETEDAAKKIARSVDTIGDHWFRAANRMRSSMADGLDMIMQDVNNAGDAFRNFAQGIARAMQMAITDMIAQWVMFKVFTGLGNPFGIASRIGDPVAASQQAGEFHSGGVVGHGGNKRSVPAATFAGAPRFHKGLAGDEFPAILQRGETVTPRGGGNGNAPTIIINNNSGQRMRQDGPAQFNGRDMIISIVADDIENGGQLRKLVQGV
jgi:uncharacterized protein YukE/molecular chaperone GrpE (heat shock protein)